MALKKIFCSGSPYICFSCLLLFLSIIDLMHYFFQLLFLKGFPYNKSFIGPCDTDNRIPGAYLNAMIYPVARYC